MTTSIIAGNLIRITTTLTALDPPGSPPSVVVAITTTDGTLVETIASPTVDVAGSVVTVTADWQIPDDQTAGVYVATVDTAGSLEAADEERFTVKRRVYVPA